MDWIELQMRADLRRYGRGGLMDWIELQMREMTPRERWLQRVSFAYGNTSFENPDITLEMVKREAEKLYGPCPE